MVFQNVIHHIDVRHSAALCAAFRLATSKNARGMEVGDYRSCHRILLAQLRRV